MPVTYLLHGIGCENPSGVHGLVINGIPLESCHEIDDPSVTAMSVPSGCTELEVACSPDDIGIAADSLAR